MRFLNSILATTITCACIVLTSCSYLPYEEAKVEVEELNLKIAEAGHDNDEFEKFLLSQNYPKDSLPIKSWGIKELFLAQEFFNYELRVAHAEWEAIQQNEKISLLSPPTSIGLVVGRGDSNEEISKNLFGASFSFSFESANKKIIRHEIAFNQSQLALLKYESIEWKAKNNLLKKVFTFSKNSDLISTLKNELRLRKSILDMLSNRVNMGIASQVDYDSLELELNDVHKTILNYQSQQQLLTHEIALLVGIDIEKFNLIPLSPINLEKSLEKVTLKFLDNRKIDELKKEAFRNNIGLRVMLAHYAISEGELKYEYAKQYPDFNFTPAYVYEFGNNIWKLGIDFLFKSNERSEIYIAKASKLRDAEVVKIMQYQLKLNNDVELIKANFINLMSQLEHARKINAKKINLTSQLLKRFDEGLLDRFMLEQELINLSKFDRQLHDAVYNLIQVGLEAESIFQINFFNNAADFYEQ